MEQDDVVVRFSHDEALVLFEWLNRTGERTNDFGDLIEDQAEQRALWNFTSLLERVLVETFSPDYNELVNRARGRLRDEDSQVSGRPRARSVPDTGVTSGQEQTEPLDVQ